MSEEIALAAGLVAEIERLRTERARVRRWARAWKRAATARQRDVHEVRVQADQKILVQGTVATIARTAFVAGLARGTEDTAHSLDLARTDNAELRASAELIHRQWRSMVAERAGLRTQIALANAENATLRDAHTAALAWLDVRGALLPAGWRDELREALHGS